VREEEIRIERDGGTHVRDAPVNPFDGTVPHPFP
jgi:hypothetical protein